MIVTRCIPLSRAGLCPIQSRNFRLGIVGRRRTSSSTAARSLELRVCQAERDQALAVAAELRASQAERDRALESAEAQSLKTAEMLEKARRRIRADAAAHHRRVHRWERPERGVFELNPENAVPLDINERGARDASFEHRIDQQRGQAATGHRFSLRPGSNRKRSRLLSAAKFCR